MDQVYFALEYIVSEFLLKDSRDYVKDKIFIDKKCSYQNYRKFRMSTRPERSYFLILILLAFLSCI